MKMRNVGMKKIKKAAAVGIGVAILFGAFHGKSVPNFISANNQRNQLPVSMVINQKDENRIGNPRIIESKLISKIHILNASIVPDRQDNEGEEQSRGLGLLRRIGYIIGSIAGIVIGGVIGAVATMKRYKK